MIYGHLKEQFSYTSESNFFFASIHFCLNLTFSPHIALNIVLTSNACGQGRFTGISTVPYEDANKCKDDEAFMACEIDPDMKAIAETNGGWSGAPPPLECFPKTSAVSVLGAWDPSLSCVDDGCNYYDGQVKGNIDPMSIPTSNSFGREDVEG